MKEELKKERISNATLQEMAGDIEKLLIEKREQLEWAFGQVRKDFKISIGVSIAHTVPVTAEYTVSFPLEAARDPQLKEKVTLKKVIGQAELEV